MKSNTLCKKWGLMSHYERQQLAEKLRINLKTLCLGMHGDVQLSDNISAQIALHFGDASIYNELMAR